MEGIIQDGAAVPRKVVRCPMPCLVSDPTDVTYQYVISCKETGEIPRYPPLRDLMNEILQAFRCTSSDLGLENDDSELFATLGDYGELDVLCHSHDNTVIKEDHEVLNVPGERKPDIVLASYRALNRLHGYENENDNWETCRMTDTRNGTALTWDDVEHCFEVKATSGKIKSFNKETQDTKVYTEDLEGGNLISVPPVPSSSKF